MVGDTIDLENRGSGTCTITFSGPNGNGGAASSLAAGNVTPTSTTYTLNTVGTSSYVVSSGSFTYTMTVIISEAPSPEPAVADESAPAWHLQQVPMPSSGSCTDVEDADLAWGTDVTGGWTRAWGDWANAWVCSRALTDAGGTWHAVDA